MASKTIFCWTASGVDYPAYLNISHAEERGEATITIIVRGPKRNSTEGATVEVTLPFLEYARLVGHLKAHFDETI